MPAPVLVSLGRGVLPADTPLLRGDDLGVLRGDGIFETLDVRGGQPWLLEEHLARMARSAQRMQLDLPDADALRGLAELACAQWPDDVEGVLRLVCTRGPEPGAPGAGQVTCYATVGELSAALLATRERGIRVATISFGFPAAARTDAPWLLGGVKSLSYAVNMASLRHAATLGVDDVLWVSSDGYVLEAPTSTLVWRDGDDLCTVPAENTGILAGTTARHLLDRAGELGLGTAERLITPAGLADMSGVWLLSSVRGVAELRAVDGVERKPSPDTARIRALLGF